jgi:hypothetical protein
MLIGVGLTFRGSNPFPCEDSFITLFLKFYNIFNCENKNIGLKSLISKTWHVLEGKPAGQIELKMFGFHKPLILN